MERNLIWAAAIAVATVGGSVAAACLMPFVALATMAAATLRATKLPPLPRDTGVMSATKLAPPNIASRRVRSSRKASTAGRAWPLRWMIARSSSCEGVSCRGSSIRAISIRGHPASDSFHEHRRAIVSTPGLRSLRPPGPHALRQSFLGQEVRTCGPVFDTGVATLMDFRIDQSGGVQFTIAEQQV